MIVSRKIAFSEQSHMATSSTRWTFPKVQSVRVFMCAGSFLMLIHVYFLRPQKK